MLEELAKGIEKVWSLFDTDFVHIKRSSVLLQCNLRKFGLVFYFNEATGKEQW